MNERLDRADALPEHSGDAFVRLAVEIEHRERYAVARWQPLDGRSNQPRDLFSRELLVCGRLRRIEIELVDVDDCAPTLGAVRLEPVEARGREHAT